MRRLLPCIAAALALVPGVREVHARFARPRHVAALPASYLERFDAVRPAVAGIPLLGYVFDPADFATMSQAAGDMALAARVQRATIALYLAQRALAPTLVRPAHEAVWFLGNFDDAARVPADWRERGLELVADGGNGVMVWRLKAGGK
jgi:hypothetical protein